MHVRMYMCTHTHMYVPCPEPLCPCYSALISKILPSLVGHGSTVRGHQHILTTVPLVWRMEVYIKQQTGTHIHTYVAMGWIIVGIEKTSHKLATKMIHSIIITCTVYISMNSTSYQNYQFQLNSNNHQES